MAEAADHRIPQPDAGGLTDREAAILAFERQWWRHAGAKEQAIRDEFGLSAARYYQLLGALIDRPEALRNTTPCWSSACSDCARPGWQHGDPGHSRPATDTARKPPLDGREVPERPVR